MQPYQRQFIEFCIKFDVLKFGQFTLKSGRISPYFFNAGLFNTGFALNQLGGFYAHAIEDANLNYDMLFGPAYKGIPLACCAAIGLANHYEKDIPYSFNRKEKKDHGESGNIVGHPLTKNVLIIDDVITAGTAIRESIPLIVSHGAKPCGIVIMLDRQECGQGSVSAIQEIETQYHIPVISIITLDDLMSYLKEQGDPAGNLDNILKYNEKYGVR